MYRHDKTEKLQLHTQKLMNLIHRNVERRKQDAKAHEHYGWLNSYKILK